MKHLSILIALIAFGITIFDGFSSYLSAQENLKANVHFYIKAYGLADPDSNTLVKRTYNIFGRVRDVADKRGYRPPGLKIINSMGDPWAVALPDGHIVLSVKAVEICYKGVDLNHGDARMAFILGHELAHLANDDFWHMETFMAISEDQNPWSERLKKILIESTDVPTAQESRRLSLAKKKEIEADDLGFLYAAIAGYRVDKIVNHKQEGKDFFSYWMDQTHTRVDINHPHPKERVRLLQIRLSKLKDMIDFYQFGVRFAHFGRYEDAIYFFLEFQQVFPSREVFNNLGYCYLQMAIKKMPPSVAFEYWLPSILDVSTRAEPLVFREKEKTVFISDEAKEVLKLSINYFEKACMADTAYLPARLNLAVAYFFTGDIFKSRAIIEEALKLDPDNIDARGLRALIIFKEASDIDMWAYSVNMLKKLARNTNTFLPVQYNLSILLEKRKRTGEAQAVWKKLVGNLESIPEPFKLNVCKKVDIKGQNCSVSKAKAPPLPWKIPAKVGSDLLEDENIKNMLTSWKHVSYNWQNGMISGRIYRNEAGSSILEVNEFLEMVVLRGKELGTFRDLIGRCGQPIEKVNVFGVRVLSYGSEWSALVKDGKVKEVWVSE